MTSTETVAIYFDATPRQIERASRGYFRFSLLLAVAFIVMAVLLALPILGVVLHAWFTADWMTPLDDAANALQTLVLFLTVTQVFIRWEHPEPRLNDQIATLRRVAQVGAEKSVADEDAEAGDAQSRQESPAGPLAFRKLRRSARNSAWWRVIGLFYLLLALISGAIAIADVFDPPSLGNSPHQFADPGSFYEHPITSALVAIACFGPGIYLLFQASRMARRMRIVTDDWGIRWRDARRRGEHTLAWHEIRAVVVFGHRTSIIERTYRLYAVLGDDAMLAWDTKPEQTRAHAEHERLLRVIAARTRLRPRDLSAVVEALEKPEASPQGRQQSTFRRRIRANPALGAGLVVMSVALLLCGAGLGLEKYQELYFSGLAGSIQQETPLQGDGFGADDARWPVETSDGNTPTTTLAQGTYAMTAAPDLDAYALSHLAYGDAAVEVTAKLTSSFDPSTYGDAVGIVVRGSGGSSTDPDSGVVFEVHASGQWEISGFNSTSLQDDTYLVAGFEHSDAIHTGVGATNRLLLVMRGSTFLCYINDQFVGSAYDSSGVVARSGTIGVYTNAAGMFSHFAVYSVQPPTSFWYV